MNADRVGPPAVLNLITTMEPDGAQVVLLDTLRLVASRSHRPYRIILGFLAGRGTALAGASLPEGMEVVDLSRAGRFDPLAIVRIARLIRRDRVRLVHTHLVHAGILGKIAARVTGAAAITTRHYVADPKERTFAYRLENRLTAGSAAVIAVTRAIAEHLRNARICAPERIVVIPNGVDVSVFDPRRAGSRAGDAAAGGTVIGCAGRLHPQKGHAVLIEAFARIARERGDVDLEIAGDGPLRGALEGRAREMGIAERVRFLGAVSHGAMPETIARWDLFVMPSLREGFGIAAAEAMAMERAVVASGIEGLAEVVDPGETGLLVPPNDPEALAEAVLSLIRDPERRRRMGERGRERVTRHMSIEATASRVADLYERLLSIE